MQGAGCRVQGAGCRHRGSPGVAKGLSLRVLVEHDFVEVAARRVKEGSLRRELGRLTLHGPHLCQGSQVRSDLKKHGLINEVGRALFCKKYGVMARENKGGAGAIRTEQHGGSSAMVAPLIFLAATLSLRTKRKASP